MAKTNITAKFIKVAPESKTKPVLTPTLIAKAVGTTPYNVRQALRAATVAGHDRHARYTLTAAQAAKVFAD
jgi:predicted transcriptional regulator